jgi:F-type H+-transporting ATPase subunit epsilon
VAESKPVLPETIELEIVTPQKHVLAATVTWVEIPGRDGYLGILPGHAALITELGIGVLVYRIESETNYVTVMNGFAEVLAGRVIVLAEVAERAAEIDVARAESARHRAQERLVKSAGIDVDWNRAELALQRATARLEAGEKAGSAGSIPVVAGAGAGQHHGA